MRLIPSIVIGCLFGCTTLLMSVEEAASESTDSVLERSIHTGPCTHLKTAISVGELGFTVFFQEDRNFFIVPYIINIDGFKYFLAPNEKFDNFIPICGEKPTPSENLSENLKNSRKYVLKHLDHYPKLSLTSAEVEKIKKLSTEEKIQNGHEEIKFAFTDIVKISLTLRNLFRLFEETEISLFENKSFNIEGDTIKLIDENEIITEINQTTSKEKSIDQESVNNISLAGQYKLIVVSLSKKLNEKGQSIQNSLINVLVDSADNIESPFMLLAIESGRRRNDVFTSDELADEEKEAAKERIRQMSFSSEDLRAMDDLEIIDVFIEERAAVDDVEPVGGVLYLTDNTGMLEKIPRKQLGVPLGWREDRIRLTVLTTQDCTPWKERAKATCIEWQDQSGQLEKELKTFLQVK